MDTFYKCKLAVHINIITTYYTCRLKVIARNAKHTLGALFLLAYDFTGTVAILLSHCRSNLQSIRGTAGLLRKSSRAKDLKGQWIILQVQCGFRGAFLTLTGDKDLQMKPRISVEEIL